MSLIKDYINRGYRGLQNLSQVVEGHYNLVLDRVGALEGKKKEISEQRLDICTSCIFNSFNAKKEGIYHSHLSDPHCTICTCPTEVKVLAYSTKCPLDEIVLDVENVPYQYTGGKLYKILGATPFYVGELTRNSASAETILINEAKYLKLNIESKFKEFKDGEI